MSDQIKETTPKFYSVNGKDITVEEFETLKKQAETGAIKLKKLSEGRYKKLDKMKG
jgi:hypothetical protein